MSDPTPLANPLDYRSSADLAGFELYESGLEFLANLGVRREDALKIPELVITTVATLVQQNDRSSRRFERLREQVQEVVRERNHLRAIVGSIEHTPQQNPTLPG